MLKVPVTLSHRPDMRRSIFNGTYIVAGCCCMIVVNAYLISNRRSECFKHAAS